MYILYHFTLFRYMHNSNQLSLGSRVNVTGYPRPLYKNAINVVKIDKNNNLGNNIDVIGSSSYNHVVNYGDFDLIERISKEKSKIVLFFKRNIQRVVKKILRRPNFVFCEVKLGLDPRYNIDLGKLNNKLIWIPPDNFINSVMELFSNGLLTSRELEVIKRAYDEKSQLSYERVYDIFRERSILRWTASEILRNKKKLVGGTLTTIEECILYRSNCNIELIANINYKFRDLSTFFVLTYTDNNGNLLSLNMPDNIIHSIKDFMLDNLSRGLYKCIYSKLKPNLYKALKRYYSYARISGNEKLMKILLPYLNGKIGRIGSISSQISSILKYLKRVRNSPFNDVIKSQVDDIKFQLQKISELSSDDLEKFTYELNVLQSRKFSSSSYIRVLTSVLCSLYEITERLAFTALNKEIYDGKTLFDIPNKILPKTNPFNDPIFSFDAFVNFLLFNHH